MQGLNAGEDNASGTAAAPQVQVDALSNILENLGMPQNNASASTNTSTASDAPATNTATPAPSVTPSATTSTTGGLTLSDLQGAMAGLATTSPPSSTLQPPGPPLHEVVSPSNIIQSGILDNPTTKQKHDAMLIPTGWLTTPVLCFPSPSWRRWGRRDRFHA